MLALCQGDRQEEPYDELIEAASLMGDRRERPGICLDIAQPLPAGYGADAARLEDPSGRITAMWLFWSFERL